MGVRHKSNIFLRCLFSKLSYLVIPVKDLLKIEVNMFPKVKSIKFQSNSGNYFINVIFNAGLFFYQYNLIFLFRVNPI